MLYGFFVFGLRPKHGSISCFYDPLSTTWTVSFGPKMFPSSLATSKDQLVQLFFRQVGDWFSLEDKSNSWILSSNIVILWSMCPKSKEFHSFNLILTSFSFPPKWVDDFFDHTSLIIFMHPGCVSQQFWNLNGFGPQFLSFGLINSGLWSEIDLFKIETYMDGMVVIHYGFTKRRSSLLLACPWCQVNHPFEARISNRCSCWIKHLKSWIPVCDTILLPLLRGSNTSIKSPRKRHGVLMDF